VQRKANLIATIENDLANAVKPPDLGELRNGGARASIQRQIAKINPN